MTKTKVFSVRLDANILAKLQSIAKKEDRSVNYIINSILKKLLKNT